MMLIFFTSFRYLDTKNALAISTQTGLGLFLIQTLKTPVGLAKDVA